MGNNVIISELLKQVSLGAGGVGILFIIATVLVIVRVRRNSEDIKEIKPKCAALDDDVGNLKVTAAKLETNQGHLLDGQKAIFGKLDDLAKMHSRNAGG